MADFNPKYRLPVRDSKPSASATIKRSQKSMRYVGGIAGGFFGVLVVVLLARWFLSSALGGDYDPLFKPYSDGSGLYYFDVFGYLYQINSAFQEFRKTFVDGINSLAFPSNDNIFESFYNMWIWVFNMVLFFLKIIVFIPLTCLASIMGWTWPSWFEVAVDGTAVGWIPRFLQFTFPYLDLPGVPFIGDFIIGPGWHFF